MSYGKGLVLGAGIRLVFGAALGSAGLGIIFGAGIGLALDQSRDSAKKSEPRS